MFTTMNPVYALEGKQLNSGWKVSKRLPVRGEPGAEGKTGGNFSVGYIVENGSTSAFMKVFDITHAFAAPADRIAFELQRISTAYIHEKELLDLCRSARLDRIVQVLDHGTITDGLHPPIFYLIFEKADGDIRSVLGSLGLLEDSLKFKHLHHVAIGLDQLHKQKVAHQDLKPSNVLIFERDNGGAKIGDLGRASRLGKEAEHDSYMIAGDPNYAPPEQLYGYRAAEWVNRREACDLYHLGALMCFLFSGISPTVGTLSFLGKEMIPAPMGPWHGGYPNALPFLTAAFTKFMGELEPRLPEWCQSELANMIKTACDPDVKRRGDPKARLLVGSPVGIDRYISRIAQLSKKGEVYARIEENKRKSGMSK